LLLTPFLKRKIYIQALNPPYEKRNSSFFSILLSQFSFSQPGRTKSNEELSQAGPLWLRDQQVEAAVAELLKK
jgi:hypothetical protein